MKKVILPCIISFIIMTITNCCFASTATVNATAVRIREGASTDSKIITNIYEDDEVEILEENDEWYKVKYGENVGYAKSEFFIKKAESSEKENSTKTEPVETENIVTNPVAENQSPQEQPVIDPQENTEIKELNVGETVILPSNIKLRIIPSFSTTPKTEIASGTNIAIMAELGNWYKVTDQTTSGWVVKSKLIQISTPTVETPTPIIPEPAPETPSESEVSPIPEAPENTTPLENTTVPDPKPEEKPIENIVEKPAEQPVEQPQEKPETPETTTSTNRKAIVIVETARVRESASTTADIVEMLDEDDIVTIVGEEGGFYKITSSKVNSGYISKSLVKEKDVTSRSMKEERENEEENQELSQETTASITGNDIVSFAKQYLGYPYVLGCSTPEKGFDCSGFTRYVYGNFGYKLGQVAAQQTSLGEVVEREKLQTGDLILFYNDAKNKIGHCGIYMNDGNFIHSANPQRGVVIDNLNTNSYYNQRFVTARRIIK